MRKTTFVLGLVLIAATSVAFAALVNYLSNTITTEIEVESPIELVGEGFVLDIEYGGEYDYVLIKGTNKADVPIETKAKLTVEKYNESTEEWEPVYDGWYIAATEDIQYYFDESINWTEPTWEDWMANHWDWLDWYVLDPDNLTICTMTQEIIDEYAPIYNDVTPGTAVYAPGPCMYNKEMLDPDLENISNNPDLVPVLTKIDNTIVSPYVTIEPGPFCFVIKFGTMPNIEPGVYRISLTMVP